MSETFDLRAVDEAVAGTAFAGKLHHLRSTASTNDLALQAALGGARTGAWIADEQTAGRGRGTHQWHSPAGEGLYLTALIAPQIGMPQAVQLSLRVAMAVQAVIAGLYGFSVPERLDIRWPNDLMLRGADGRSRKAGGILIDTASDAAMLRYAIVGIGVNVNQRTFPPELEPIATSIRRELPRADAALHREPLAAAILLALDDAVSALAAGGGEMSEDFARCSTWVSGKRVRVEARDGDPGYTGTTAGLDAGGFLLVECDDGTRHTVLSGGLREL